MTIENVEGLMQPHYYIINFKYIRILFRLILYLKNFIPLLNYQTINSQALASHFFK